MILALTAGMAFTWFFVCLVKPRWAVFLLAMLSPLLGLIMTNETYFQYALASYYSLMVAFFLANPPLQVDLKLFDMKLLVTTLLYFLLIFINQMVMGIQGGSSFLRLTLVKLSELMPLVWMLLGSPVLASLRARKALLSGFIAGSCILVAVHFGIVRPWNRSNYLQLLAENHELLQSMKNAIGISISAALFILAEYKFRKHRRLKICAISFLVIGLGLLFSRTAYLAASIMLISYLFIHGFKFRSLWLPAAISVICIYLLPESITGAVAERISTTWSEAGGLDSSSAIRIELWGLALQQFFQHPLTGVGLGKLSLAVGQHSGLITVSSSDVSYAHNFFLSLFSQTGFLGGLLGIGLFYYSCRCALRWIGKDAELGIGLTLAVIGFLAGSFFGEPLFERSTTVVYMLLLSTIAYGNKDIVFHRSPHHWQRPGR